MERINIQLSPTSSSLSSCFLSKKRWGLSGPSIGEKHFLFFCSRDCRDLPAMIVRPASTFTISHPLLPTTLLSIYFSIPAHSPRSLVHDPRNKDPEDGRGGREEWHRREIIGDGGGIAGKFQECLWKLHSIGSSSEKKTSPTSSPKKKFARWCLDGDIFLRISFIIKKKKIRVFQNAVY